MRNVALAAFAGLLVVMVGLVSRAPRPPVRAASAPVQEIPKTLQVSGPPTQSEPVRARAFAATPGAIVCGDFRTVSRTVELYAKASEEQSQDLLTHGQSRLLRGPAEPTPEPSKQGCLLVPPGSELLLEPGNVVPVVRVQIGPLWARGVTLSEMITAPLPKPEPAVSSSAGRLQQYAQPTIWTPVSEPAQSITGPAEFSTSRVVLAGHAYVMALQRTLQPAEMAHAAALFRSAPPAAADGFWFRVAVPENAAMLNNSGLCGHQDAVWLLALITGDQRDALGMAFYSGREVPDLAPPALTDTSHLCGTFDYVPQLNEASANPGRDALALTLTRR